VPFDVAVERKRFISAVAKVIVHPGENKKIQTVAGRVK
jgi:hypothetical protein